MRKIRTPRHRMTRKLIATSGSAAALAAAMIAAPALGQQGAVQVQVVQGFAVAAPAPAKAANATPTGSEVVIPPNTPLLSLVDGGFVIGDLLDSSAKDTIRWKSPAFAEPIDFNASAVNAAHWPMPKDAPKAKGAYCFELAGGDVLYGSLDELGENVAVLDVPPLGKLHVERAALQRIERWGDSADLIYSGPIGLDGWVETAEKKGWRDEAGQPLTDQEGATLRGNIGLPARAVVEFEISWKNTPDFVLALGVPADDKEEKAKEAANVAANGQESVRPTGPTSRAFRFEVWDGKLVAHRETQAQSDVATLQTIGPGQGRAHIQAYLDQEQGRMIVVSPGGETLADLKVADPGGKPLPAILLSNIKGDVRLERLRIRKWSGESLKPAKADQSRIHLSDGSVVYGKVERFDAGSKEFLVKSESGETKIPQDKIAAVFLSPPTDEPNKPVRAVFAPRAVRVVAQDGSRLSGDLVKVEGGELTIAVPGVKETPHMAAKSLRSLIVDHREADAEKDKAKEAAAVEVATDAPKPPTAGRLELEGVKLKGRLVDAKTRPGASCLSWKADGALAPSAIAPGTSGRIVYKEPKPAPPTQPGMRPIVRVRPAAPAGFVAGVFGALADQSGSRPSGPVSGRRALHLRTGDVIPSEIVKIDEAGVTFKSTISDSTFVAHEKIKAIELAPEPPPTIRLTRAKRDRLLTLPRMQKDSPPTQMIRAKNGDFLRGRVMEMDDKTLTVESHLETKKIPRDRVSRIIWLHADEVERPKKPEDPKAKADEPKKAEEPKKADEPVVAKAEPPKPADGTRVQAVRSDGIRLTFSPEELTGPTLSGKSEVLGACKVQLDEVDSLLIGSAIEKAASQLAFGIWKLHDAVEPLVAQDTDGDGSGDRQPGTESALVGKPAPDFNLDLLGGEKFHLAEAKGSIVILDFWATWCGPCLQAMPQVEAVAEEFKGKGVKLVAVNLEEEPKTIKSMMERHKMKMTVALDRDGATAQKYQANAIPQTVIIDKDGNVARLYVGGGPKLGDKLREALEEVISDKKKEKPAEPAGEPGVIKD